MGCCSRNRIDDSKQQRVSLAKFHSKEDKEQSALKAFQVVRFLNRLKNIHPTTDKTTDVNQLGLNRT